MPSPIILSVSDLNHHHTCPTAFLARYTLRHWSTPGRALTTGKALHQLLEAKWAPNPPTPLATLLESPDLDPQARILFSQIPPDWQPPYIITAAETPLLWRLPPDWLPPHLSHLEVYLAGTPDAITQSATGSGSGQYKSVALGRSPESLVDSICFGLHELTYALLRLHNNLPPVQELHVLLFRKLTKQAILDGTPAFLHHIRPTPHLTSLSSLLSLARRDLLPRLHATLTTIIDGPLASRHAFESCTGPFYNSPCPLYLSCHTNPLGTPSPDRGRLPSGPGISPPEGEHPGNGHTDPDVGLHAERIVHDPLGWAAYLPEPAPCRYSHLLAPALAVPPQTLA